MIKYGKKVCAIVCAVLSSMFMFTGCHGSEGLRAFEIPEEFDTTRQYEIVFWAKNDTGLLILASASLIINFMEDTKNPAEPVA